jgi:adenylosuccinate synthase
MPVSVVIGGQYGSEGKGKVAQHLARQRRAAAVVRVGGSNSGHTGVAPDGRTEVLRQLPTAALDPDAKCVLAAGAYLDTNILLAEIERTGLTPERLLIDENAFLVRPGDIEAEAGGDLGERIGSTCSGTGAAVARRVARQSPSDLAASSRELRPYIGDVSAYMRDCLDRDRQVVVEGTQGFGLSLLHSQHFPKVTSRDTTAAAALSEAGLSPFDVTDVTLVLRAFPIRVAGNSGPFGAEEIDWTAVAEEGGHSTELTEFTSVTKRPRRVARFDPVLVRRAIAVNRPSTIVLNHVDHVDAAARDGVLTSRARQFVAHVSEQIDQEVDFVGLGPDSLLPTSGGLAVAA